MHVFIHVCIRVCTCIMCLCVNVCIFLCVCVCLWVGPKSRWRSTWQLVLHFVHDNFMHFDLVRTPNISVVGVSGGGSLGTDTSQLRESAQKLPREVRKKGED